MLWDEVRIKRFVRIDETSLTRREQSMGNCDESSKSSPRGFSCGTQYSSYGVGRRYAGVPIIKEISQLIADDLDVRFQSPMSEM